MRYGTPSSWAKYFKENENLQISHTTISKKLNEAGKIGDIARNTVGRILNNWYSEVDVRSACEKLLQPLPTADENGFIMKGGERYGNADSLAKFLGISRTGIVFRINTYKPPKFKGRDRGGRICDFYSIHDICSMCSESFQDLPQANEDSFILNGGERYGTVSNLSRILSISDTLIISRIKTNKLQALRGRDRNHRIFDFYSESEVRRICSEYLETPQADEKGFIIIDGKRYGTFLSLSKIIGLSVNLVIERIKYHKIKSIKGRNRRGRICDFYSESEVRRICSEYLETPQADEKGFIIIDNEKYGTIDALSRSLGISKGSIASRIKNNKPKMIKGKVSTGRICDYYSESEIRTICADLLQDLPLANENGFFEKNRVRYGTIVAWCKFIDIASGTLSKKLKKYNKPSIKGKIQSGHIWAFYSESDVREVTTNHLANIPRADKDGFFEEEGIRYGTIIAWANRLDLLSQPIIKKLRKFNKKGIKGRNRRGHIHDFYSEADIQEICSDFLKDDLPQANDDGYFEKDGEIYKTRSTWRKELGISDNTMKFRLKSTRKKSVKGRGKTGVRNYYSESDINSACADLLDDIPNADKYGFFEKEGKKYGTISAWSKFFNISQPTILQKLKKNKKQSIKGRSKTGIRNYYSELDVRSICANLIEDMPKADDDGFFEKDKVKYGTVSAWSRALNVLTPAIAKRVKKSQIKGIKGKDQGGRITIFYSKSDIYSLCKSYFEDMPKADKSGFFEKEGIRYGTIWVWGKSLSISPNPIRKVIKKSKIKSIRGRGKTGIRNFYSEPDIRSACADILEKRQKSDTANPQAA